MRIYLLLSLLFTVLLSNAQHTNNELSHEEKADAHHDLRIGLVVAHTYIPTHTATGPETFIVPTVGLDIEYWHNHKWGVGFHNDLELETFEVATDNGLYIEKKFPLLVTADILYKPFKNFVILAGPGYEFEEKENLVVFRAGLEYEVEINDVWDFAPTIIYDYRHEAFDTWAYGIGVGIRF